MRNARELIFESPQEAEVGQHVQVLEQMAQKVRTIYCVLMQQVTGNAHYGRENLGKWDGTSSANNPWGTSSKPVWPKIAKAIISVDADPLLFISAQFSAINRSSPPRPNQLHTEAAISRWEEYRYRYEERLRQQIDSDINQLQIRTLPFIVNLNWDSAKALNYVLREGDGAVSPLICYCAAVTELLPIATAFKEGALLQYLFQKDAYDRLLPTCVPADLQEEATLLRHRLVPR